MDTSLPGEVSAEEYYEIRMQIAEEIMGGKYEFVLTIDIDNKNNMMQATWTLKSDYQYCKEISITVFSNPCLQTNIGLN